MTPRRSADRRLLWTQQLHAINTDVPGARLRIFAYIDMPGANISTSIEVAPLRNRQFQKIDVARGNNVLQHRTSLDQHRFERRVKPLLSFFYKSLPGGCGLQTKSQRDRASIPQAIGKHPLIWITLDVLEEERRAALPRHSSEIESPIDLFSHAHQLSGVGENLNEVAQIPSCGCSPWRRRHSGATTQFVLRERILHYFAVSTSWSTSCPKC